MISQFPSEIAHIISDYTAIWTIIPWVRELGNKILIHSCWPGNATLDDVKRFHLSANPMACDELATMGSITPTMIANNSADWAFDLIEPMIDKYELIAEDFIRNTNPRAIAFIESHIESITPNGWSILLENPSAIELIKKYNGIEKASDQYRIYTNPNEATWDLVKYHHLTADIELMSAELSLNYSSWATRLISEKNIERPFYGLCKHHDPNILEALLSHHDSKLTEEYWEYLSENPAAISILREHPDKITCEIWSNPAIFEPTPRPGVLNILTELSW